MLRLFSGFFLLISILALTSCGGGETKTPDATASITEYTEPSDKQDIIQVDGEIISIPSPIQSAIFIKENGSGFNETLLLDAKNLDPYQTNAQKAIALGVYGAELGYVALYKEDDRALGYMNTARKLADDIGISNAFDESLVERFSNNMSQPDSMVVLVSDIYEAADSYLKTNERTDMAGLVLFGGWIESFNITCSEAGNSPAIRERMAEQKSGFERLHRLLSKGGDSAILIELSPMLDALKTAFDGVNSTYSFQRPVVDKEKQLTIFKSNVVHEMDDATMAEITAAATAIRNHITGNK